MPINDFLYISSMFHILARRMEDDTSKPHKHVYIYIYIYIQRQTERSAYRYTYTHVYNLLKSFARRFAIADAPV